MIEIIEIGSSDSVERLLSVLGRTDGLDSDILVRADAIVRDVRLRGDAALIDYTARFDGLSIEARDLRASQEEIDALAGSVDHALVDAMRQAIANIHGYHENQLIRDWEIERANGVRLGQRVRPLEIVGLYVPGGTAAYPSTVMMNAIPAIVAGVDRIVVATPPTQFSRNPVIAAVLKELGLSEVYTIGGAQAIAALAHGTATIPRVDKIVGPGNQYVAAAKKLLYGVVAIDSIAGPSEIVVIADDSARPDFIAADLLSQAEHSEDAASILVTTSKGLAEAVRKEIIIQTETLSRKATISRSLERYGALIVVDSLDAACSLVDRIAPEHVEVITSDAEAVADRLRHAGAIFIGQYSPEAVGDYFAGTNHVLPTGGTARFSSALGVYDFQKRTSIIRYSQKALEESASSIDLLARAEGFDAHARSVTIRNAK
jgi:histidinol dehydrogenase